MLSSRDHRTKSPRLARIRPASSFGVARTTRAVLSLLSLLAAAGGPAQAQTWTGLGVTNNWNDPLNWQGLLPPQSAPGTAITFAGVRRPNTVQNLAAPFALNALTFASGAAGFTIAGNALRFEGASARLVQNTGNLVTLAVPIAIGERLTYSGNGSATFKGTLSSASPAIRAELVKQGTGRLTLTEPSRFDGLVRIEQGQLRIEDAQALALADVTLAVDNGLDLSGVSAVTLGGLSGGGALALGTTHLTVGANDGSAAPYTGNISASTGSLTKTGTGAAELWGSADLARLRVERGDVVLRGGLTTLGDSDEGLHVGLPGAGAPATLALRDGARVLAQGRTVQVDGAVGTRLQVLGSGSRLDTGFQMLVGNHATGEMVVGDGGRSFAGGFLAMGFNNGSQGTLDVRAGGVVTSPEGLLGVLVGSSGSASVAGAGARWDNTNLGLGGFSADLRGGTGTLSVGPDGVVTAAEALTLWTASSRLSIDGGQVRVGRLASDGAVGNVELLADGAAGPALVIDGGSGAASFAGVISGPGSLRKTGGGVQTLAGANTFGGQTLIEGGRIVLANPLALQNSTVQLAVDGGLDLADLPEATVGNLAGSGALALGDTTLSFGTNAQTVLYTGTVTGGSSGSLVKQGSGTSTLGGTGSSFNNLRVNDGTLRLSGGTLQLNSARRDGRSAIIVGGAGGGVLEVGGGAVVATNATGDSSVFVDGPAGTRIAVDGSGTRLEAGFQTVVGNFARGELTVSAGAELHGRLALAAGFAGGSDGALTLVSGGRATVPLVGLGVLAGATGAALVSGAGSELVATSQLGVGGITASQNGGSGMLTLRDGGLARAPRTVMWNDASRVRIEGGQLLTGALVGGAAGSEVALVSDPLSGPALLLDGTAGVQQYAGRITGAGSVHKQGSATQVLAGANSFTGAVRVFAGTLDMASSAASEHDVRGGVLRLGERHLGSSVVQAAPGAAVVYTASSLTGGLLLGTGTHDIAAVQRVVGTQVANGVELRPDGGAGGARFVGVVNHGRVVNAAGRSLDWTGGSNALGTLVVAGSTAVSGFGSTGVIEVQAGGTLVNTGTDLLLGGGSRTLIGSATEPGGTLQLPDDSRVQLNGGLLVNNGTLDGALNVNFGALAKGAGSFGAVTVTDGGRFSPGNSPGLALSGSATWAAGGAYLVELASAEGTAGQDWDLWRVDGLLDITAGTTANSRFTLSVLTLDAGGAPGALAGFDPLRAWSWQIVDTAAGIAGFDFARLTLDTSGFASATAGGSFSLALSGGDLYLQFAPVPEPGTWALWLAGLAGVGFVAARRRGRPPEPLRPAA